MYRYRNFLSDYYIDFYLIAMLLRASLPKWIIFKRITASYNNRNIYTLYHFFMDSEFLWVMEIIQPYHIS